MKVCEAYLQAVLEHDVPVPVLAENAKMLIGKSEQEQNRLREAWAMEIKEKYPIKFNPLADREDLLRGIGRNDALRNMYHVIQMPDEIIAEMKQRTEGKSDAEMDAILKKYIDVFKRCPHKC